MMSERSDDEMLDAGLAQVAEGARAEARHEFWRHYWPRRVVPLLVAFTTVISIVTGIVVANLYGLQSDTQAAVSALRLQAEQSKASGDKANAELEARGQPQVPIPAPGTAPDTDVIVSAAAARVLASLPNFATKTELGRAIAEYFAANPITPVGPTPMQIAAVLAGYLALNPPPSGPAGEPGASGTPGIPGPTGPAGPIGERGPPPTAEQIQAAFVQYVQDNPDALCPKGGSFAQLRIQLADGGAADTWQCVVATYPPPSSTASQILPTP